MLPEAVMQDSPPEVGWYFGHPVVWASGLAGAMVSLVHAKGLTVWQKVGTLVVGTVTAGFLTPAIADGLKLSLNLAAATGFLLGIAGMMLTAIVVNAATKARDDPTAVIAWVLGLVGKGPQKEVPDLSARITNPAGPTAGKPLDPAPPQPVERKPEDKA